MGKWLGSSANERVVKRNQLKGMNNTGSFHHAMNKAMLQAVPPNLVVFRPKSWLRMDLSQELPNNITDPMIARRSGQHPEYHINVLRDYLLPTSKHLHIPPVPHQTFIARLRYSELFETPSLNYSGIVIRSSLQLILISSPLYTMALLVGSIGTFLSLYWCWKPRAL